ncbi:MAG: NAD(P)/FAD-dependent oxidoreductase [Gammaproteobacteria bacterium]|nr:NAD(P)/FAD-dependent oxidoreductase [Gammaproteobacteria bacterium]
MPSPAAALHRIVIVGGGAGGLELATALGHALGKPHRAEVFLVDSELTHLWKPLLHEVAAGTMDSHGDELSYLAQAHWHGFKFQLGRVISIDRGRRSVRTAPTLDDTGKEYVPARSLEYGTLILAVGSQSNDFGIAGVREHCHFLDNRVQADGFHQHLLRSYYAAHTGQQPLRPGQLHIAIVGAGATGVELAAELLYASRELIRYGLDRIDLEQHVRITIIEAADRILPGLPPRLSAQVSAELQAAGIEILTSERIEEAVPEGFRTHGGRFLPAEIKVWAAGIKAPDFLARIEGLECNRLNQLVVRHTLQTTRDDNIFALGDCAACPMRGAPGDVPPRAQSAHQQAAMLVRSMMRRLEGGALPEYRYVDYGSLINLSRYSTIGSLMGNIARLCSPSIFVEGMLARLVYLSLYKMHQIALHGFFRTALGTLANVLTRRTRPRMKLH